MGKLIKRERFQGVGLEITKVLFLFSLVSEALIFLLSAYTHDLSYMPLLLVLLLVPVYSVLVRRLIPSFILFFLAHAALYGLVYLVRADVLVMVIIGGYITVDVIYIYVRKISGVNDPMSVAQLIVAFVLAFVLYIMAEQLEATASRPVLIAFFIIQVVAYLVYFHQMNVRETLSVNTQSASQTIKKINRLNNKVIIMFIGVLLVLIGAGVVMRLDIVITLIGQGLLFLLKTVVRFLFRGGSEQPAESSLPSEEIGGQDMAGMIPDDYETWKIWLILEKVMVVFSVLVVLALIGYVFYRLYQKFKADRVEEDILSDYAETTISVERAARPKKERRTLAEIFNLPNDRKIRRLFQKKIQHRIKAGDPIRATQTPREMCAAVKAEDLSLLTGLYEKARYSDQEITKEEVKSVS